MPRDIMRVLLNYKLWLSEVRSEKRVNILAGIIYRDHQEDVGLLLPNGEECVKLS